MTREAPASNRHRTAARLVLQDHHRSVLLVRFQADDTHWWATPGGGTESDESLEDAAHREAIEELGVPIVLQDKVWIRRAQFTSLSGVPTDQTEHYFRAELTGIEISPDLDRLRNEGVTAVRWWTRAELSSTTEVIYPVGLADLLDALPSTPADTPIEIE